MYKGVKLYMSIYGVKCLSFEFTGETNKQKYQTFVNVYSHMIFKPDRGSKHTNSSVHSSFF